MKKHYFLAHDVSLPSGGTLRDCRLSRRIARLGTLRKVAKRIQRRVPDTFTVEVRQRLR